MKLGTILTCGILASFTLAFGGDEIVLERIPDEDEAASIARTLVARESLANINTFTSIPGRTGPIPVSLMEYYADCDNDGDPYWLVVDIGSTNRNIARGSSFSWTIRVGDHPRNDDVDPNYPGAIPSSPAGSPRINLVGRLENVTFSNPRELIKLERCFVARHPDAKYWLPYNPITPHNSHWTKFVVEEIYMAGGFGDRAYIGTIDSKKYHQASTLPNEMKY